MQRGDGWRVRETPAFRDRGMEGERDTCREGEGWRVRHMQGERGMEDERDTCREGERDGG